MAQSLELLLDPEAEAAVQRQWRQLAAAGLPSEDRSQRAPTPGGEHHRPHITLYAADRIAPSVEDRLAAVVAELDLELAIGSVLVFGPRRGRCILVRLIVPTVELLRLQAEVAAVVDADPRGQFGPGRWSPHVTLARRVPVNDVGACLSVLGDAPVVAPVVARVSRCRRWDGAAKQAWLL